MNEYGYTLSSRYLFPRTVAISLLSILALLPVIITLYFLVGETPREMLPSFNQLDLVRVTVACANEEFAEADYKKFNLSMCQYLDSAELAMYS